jgi:hypothetical protein
VFPATHGSVDSGSLIRLKQRAGVVARLREVAGALERVGTRMRIGLPLLIAAVTGRYSCE